MARIMVVDDDVDLTDSYTIALKAKGHEVLAVNSDKEARVEIEGFRPDVLVLDVMMDELYSGVDFAQEIHGRFPGLPILMVSGFNELLKEKMEFTPHDTLLPIVKFVDKPVVGNDILREVEQILARPAGG